MLRVLALVLFGVLGQLSGHPHVLNYPVAITEANAAPQYANAARLLRCVRFAIMVVFGLFVGGAVRTALGHTDGLGSWLLPLTPGLLFGPLGYFVVKSPCLRGARRRRAPRLSCRQRNPGWCGCIFAAGF